MDAVKVAVGIALAWGIAYCIDKAGKIYLTYLTNKTRLLEEEKAELEEKRRAKNSDYREKAVQLREQGPFSDPEDPDLVVYLREALISSMAIDYSTHTVNIVFTDGWGYVFNPQLGGTLMFPKPQEGVEFGEDVAMLGEFTISSTMPSMEIDRFAQFAKMLSSWQHNGTPLKVCLAPGSMATVMEEADEAHWLPLPMG